MVQDPGQEDPLTQIPPSVDTGGSNSAAADAVRGFYTKYLGRPPQPGDVEKWLSGAYGWGDANNLAGIENGIRYSDEGAQYSSQHTTPANTQNTPAGAFATTGGDYSAFDTARLQQPGKSAKDAFVMLANQAPGPPFGDKAALAAWFNKYIKPGMDNLGHKVSSVTGDSFTYSNGEGTFTVDYAENAGAPAGSGLTQRLRWGAEPGDAATAAKYGGGGGGGVLGPNGSGGGGGFSASAYGGGGGDWPTLDIPSYEPYAEYTPTEWVPPKPEDVYNDPSYQFRYEEGLKPVTNSRALAGLTRSGATIKALQRYGQQFASDEFGRIYDRAADTYDRTERNRFGAYTTNKNSWDTTYGFKADEAAKEFAPKQRFAELEYGRDWDVYKFQNDDAFRYYNADLNARTIASRPVD